MTDPIRPIPTDPLAADLAAFMEFDQSWILGDGGDYATAAVEAMTRDGGNYQRLVALQWPGRINHTDEHVTVRLLMDPRDAYSLAHSLLHSVKWLAAAKNLGV
jgi:hypothetical protein